MKSLRHYLTFIMITIVVISFLTSNIIGGILVSNNFESQIQENHQRLGNSIMLNVQSFIQKNYAITEQIAKTPSIFNFDPDSQTLILEETISRHPYFDLFFIQGTDGMQTARSAGNLGDRSNRWWFKQIMADKKPFISKSYYSISGNIPVTSALIPIYNKTNTLMGIMGSDIRLDNLQTIVEQFSSETTYAYIIDGEGVVIAHPDNSRVSELYNYVTLEKTVLQKDEQGNIIADEDGIQLTEQQSFDISESLSQITSDVLNSSTGFKKYKDIHNDQVYSFYTPIELPGSSNSWAVVTVEKQTDALAFAKSVQFYNYGLSLILIIIVSILSMFISGRITRPISDIAELMSLASKGNLKVISNYKSNNELGALSNSFNLMVEEIRNLFVDTQEASKNILDYSNSLTDAMDTTKMTIHSVTANITQVSSASTQQAQGAEKGLEESMILSKELDIMADNIDSSTQSTLTIQHNNKDAVGSMETLETKASETAHMSVKVADVVTQLNNKTNEIISVVDTIADISDQTNLLALNASIEAARAGEHGRGFAVVADEVRKLAESTGQSTENVRKIIDSVRSDIKVAQETIKSNQLVIDSQTSAVIQTTSNFNAINTNVDGMASSINQLSTSLQQVMKSRDAFISTIENVSAISEETAASMENVTTMTDQQNQAVDNISDLADNLRLMSEKLEETLSHFIA